MNGEIKILYDEKKVIVSSQVLEEIKYLTREDDMYSKEKILLTNEMDIKEFYPRIESIIRRSKITIEFLPDRNNRMNYNTDLIYSLAQKYNELYPEEKRTVNYVDDEILGELLNVIYQINIEEKNFYLFCNLIDAKKDCLENMKYFLDEVTISQFNDEYEKAIQNKDVKKMNDMLNYVQQAILTEWEKYFASMDSMNDDNFAFIGHSTSSSQFDKNFYSKYVSTSLFNQDLTDTYRSGYGFIFAPKNIVGAKSQDMYVKNYADDEDMMLNYSVIKKIDHPQRLIDECLKLKQENETDQKVYNEVIIDGFEPIGIFCFTDGTKNLNWNYRYAQKLQESFPHLKIHSFDIMKRKKGVKLDKMKLSLLNNLQKQFTNHTFDINEDMLPRYDYFFEEYEKLKQKGEYTEEEIGVIFQNNDKLLSIFNTSPDDLFSGMYDDKQIKYILGKNVSYNIDYILSGKARAFALNNLKKLYPYRDKLNSMYDGLSELVALVSRMEITDEMMIEINNIESINFYTITKVLASKMMDSINSREQQTKQSLNNYQTRYNELKKELQERINLQEQYDYYSKIYENRFYVGTIKEDYKNLINDINITVSKENGLQNELNEIVENLNQIAERTKLLENVIYDDNVEHIYCKKIIEEIKTNVSELSKHPLLNRKRLKEEKSKLKIFEEKDETERAKFEALKFEETQELNSKKYELKMKKVSVEFELNLVQLDKKQFDEQLHILKAKIKDYFTCDSVDEIDLVISAAEEYIGKYDNMNQYYLTQLNMQLKDLANIIVNHQNSLSDIQGKKTIVSRSM